MSERPAAEPSRHARRPILAPPRHGRFSPAPIRRYPGPRRCWSCRCSRLTPGRDQARSEVRFTIATVRASGSHSKLLPPLVGLLGQWGELEGERQEAQDAVDRANALVAWRDGSLDESSRAAPRGTSSHEHAGVGPPREP